LNVVENLLVANVDGCVVRQVGFQLHQQRIAVLQLLKRHLVEAFTMEVV
jgi:hypothetical protein